MKEPLVENYTFWQSTGTKRLFQVIDVPYSINDTVAIREIEKKTIQVMPYIDWITLTVDEKKMEQCSVMAKPK